MDSGPGSSFPVERLSDCLIAAFDIGTVSCRLLVQEYGSSSETSNVLTSVLRRAEITNLGQGRSTSAYLAQEAIDRTLRVAQKFYEALQTISIQLQKHIVVITTLTSAARDALNVDTLLNGLSAIGFQPQVISGNTEAKLSFSGAALDFANQDILLVDIGGGSTEIVLGRADTISCARSFDVGCRRVTEQFIKDYPVPAQDMEAACRWIYEQFASTFKAPIEGATLVAVGGTATSLSALNLQLETYDSTQVHLSSLGGAQLADLIDYLAPLSLGELQALPALQKNRAGLVLAGALILQTILSLGAFQQLIISENDILIGLLNQLRRYIQLKSEHAPAKRMQEELIMSELQYSVVHVQEDEIYA